MWPWGTLEHITSKGRGHVGPPLLSSSPISPKESPRRAAWESVSCPSRGEVGEPGRLCLRPWGRLCPCSQVPGLTPTSPSLQMLRLCSSVAPSHFSLRPHNPCHSLLASSEPLSWPYHFHLLCLQQRPPSPWFQLPGTSNQAHLPPPVNACHSSQSGHVPSLLRTFHCPLTHLL